MAQYSLPNADISIVGCTEVLGDGDGDAFDELDEGFGAGRGSGSGPDTTSYWQSQTNPAGDLIGDDTNTLTDPGVDTGHIARWRGRKNSNGGRQIDFLNSVRKGGLATTIASVTESDVSGAWTTFTINLTTGEAANVDYADIELRWEPDAVGGGPGRVGYLTAMEFECPDAGLKLGEVALAGSGTLSAAATVQVGHLGAVALAGSGTIAASATVGVTQLGAVALAGSGTVTATATTSGQHLAAVALAGAATLAAAGSLGAGAAAALAAAGGCGRLRAAAGGCGRLRARS